MDNPTRPSDSGEPELQPISKNKLKKMKRDQEWEENRAKRKAKRKEKVQEKKQRKRAAYDEAISNNPTQPNPTLQGNAGDKIAVPYKNKRSHHVQLPITFILDCGFDDLMMDKEIKSLGAQITRTYSDNHKAPYQAHLAISSFGGHLKERFDGLLAGQYHSWRNVRFLEADFTEAATQARAWMKGDQGGKPGGVFANKDDSDPPSDAYGEGGEVVYLTSDSLDTLTELRPYSTYIVGGLVDRNRHKGICYKKAMDRGIKTAKLPIGDYMQMSSRFVLATNHVVEIMLRWLEVGDWGQAFLKVMPKRKGGVLKDANEKTDEEEVERELDGDLDHQSADGDKVAGELVSAATADDGESVSPDKAAETLVETDRVEDSANDGSKDTGAEKHCSNI